MQTQHPVIQVVSLKNQNYSQATSKSFFHNSSTTLSLGLCFTSFSLGLCIIRIFQIEAEAQDLHIAFKSIYNSSNLCVSVCLSVCDRRFSTTAGPIWLKLARNIAGAPFLCLFKVWYQSDKWFPSYGHLSVNQWHGAMMSRMMSQSTLGTWLSAFSKFDIVLPHPFQLFPKCFPRFESCFFSQGLN